MFSRLRNVCRFASTCQRLFHPSSKRFRVNFATKANPKNLVPTALSVRETKSDGTLHVTWNDNRVNRYPFVFLRDICRCPECFHESSSQRSFDTVGQLRMKFCKAVNKLLSLGQMNMSVCLILSGSTPGA